MLGTLGAGQAVNSCLIHPLLGHSAKILLRLLATVGEVVTRSRKKVRARMVALVGIDGSGKTTQAYQLADTLIAAGVPSRYWRNAGGRCWLGRLARRVGRPDAVGLLGAGGVLVIESVLRWMAIAWALTNSMFTGRVAVMDRYAVCQFVSVQAHGLERVEWFTRLAYRVFPSPEVTLLLAVEPGEAYRRIEARGTDHESMRYLVAAERAYRSMPEYQDFVVVDANRPVDEVTGEIEAALAPLLRQWRPRDAQTL